MRTMTPAIGLCALLLTAAAPAAAQEGRLRLNIDQREADVIVDGFTVGTIDDFDGYAQRLRLSAGRHHIVVQAKGYQPLTLDVTLLPGQQGQITGHLDPARPQAATYGPASFGARSVNKEAARHDVKAARRLVRQRPGATPSGLTAAEWQQVLTAAQQQARAQEDARQAARTNALLFALAAQNVGHSTAARRQPRTVVRPSSSLAVPAPNVLAPSVPAASPALSLSSAGYLGRLSANRFLPDATANRVGLYGSRYSPQSVTNPYGRFGSAYTSGSASNPYTFNAPRLVADDGTYLGKLSTNPYDPESVSNPYGRFGSRYSPTSINNPYGRYGSRYSPLSPTNPYALQPPLILTPEP